MVSKTALRKLVSLILCFMLVFPSALAADTGKDYQGHWAEESIKVLFEKGFVTGYTDGSFKPDREINRAEFMAIINRAFDFNDKAEISFKDVKEGEWHYEHVARAVKAGYIKGFTDGTMRPTQNITRQEAAVIIARILDMEKDADGMIIATLKDGNNIPEWSAKGIAAILSKGYINKSKDGSFEPAKPLTRAEMAFAIEKSYVKGIKKLYAKPGLFTGGNIDGSVKIDNKGITLMDAVINGDLILGEGIGDGDVHLLNVIVKGETLVKGGGENSIIIENCQFSKIIIVKEGNKIRILAKGSTTIDETEVQSGAKLESGNPTGEGFGYVTIAEGLDGDALVELIGNFESIEIRAEGIQVQASGGTIGNLEVAEGATNVNIDLAKDMKVTNLKADAPTTVSGTGRIETAQVNVSGSKIDVPVTKVEAPVGVKVDAPKQTPTPATTTPTAGGGGGSSRDRDDDTPSTVPVSGISITPTKMTLKVGETGTITATVNPSNATNKKVNWTTSDEKIATVDDKGNVTAVAPGTANITVTSAANSSRDASCEVIVALPAIWKATGNTGFNTVEGKAYVFQEFELLVNNERLSLHKDKVKSITVDGKALNPNTDETLWFNVLKETGKYKFVVIDNNDVTYEATLSWTAPITVEVVKVEGSEGDHNGNYYQLYKVEIDVTPEDSKVYQIKPNGTISELTVLADDDNHLNIWFRLYGAEGAQQAGDHIFLIKKGEAWSKAVIKHAHTQATWKATGGVGTHTIDDKAYVFQGFELLDEKNNRIDLVAGNIASMTVLEPGAEEAKPLIIGDDSDPLLWFNVQKASGNYKYTVKTNVGKVYEATLNWTAPAEVTVTKTGDPAYNEERKETYQLYTVEIDVSPEDSKVYQIKPDGTINELTVLKDNDNHLNIWFRLSGGVGPQQEGDHVFLIKKGETWSKAVINYKATEDPQVTAALASVNEASKDNNYAEVKTALEENATKLGLDLEIYNQLTPDGRKNAVANDIFNNKPEGGYTIDTLKPMFDEIVATRMVFQNSVALFAGASADKPLTDLSYITMLQENLNAVKLQKLHSGRDIKTDILPELNKLVEDFEALTIAQQTAVLKGMNYSATTSSTATRKALRAAIDGVKTEITGRLTITNATIVDNKAYKSTAAQGGTVRVLGYSVGINLDANSSGKKISDTTSIVVELYQGETLLGKQSFNTAGYEKHGDKSSTSGTIDAGGEYVATSWDNSWSARIDQIPDKAVATVQYTDGIATAEKTFTFTGEQTKIFYAAEAVHALFENVFAGTLVLADGVTQEDINAASGLVEAVTLNTTQNKEALQGLITEAQTLFSRDEGTEQEANIEMMQFVPKKPVAKETLELEAETEAAEEETAENETNEEEAEEQYEMETEIEQID